MSAFIAHVLVFGGVIISLVGAVWCGAVGSRLDSRQTVPRVPPWPFITFIIGIVSAVVGATAVPL